MYYRSCLSASAPTSSKFIYRNKFYKVTKYIFVNKCIEEAGNKGPSLHEARGKSASLFDAKILGYSGRSMKRPLIFMATVITRINYLQNFNDAICILCIRESTPRSTIKRNKNIVINIIWPSSQKSLWAYILQLQFYHYRNHEWH